MIAAETVLVTRDGAKTASDISGSPVQLWTGHRFATAELESRGTQEVIELLWRGGNSSLVTPDHLFSRGLERRPASDMPLMAYGDVMPPHMRVDDDFKIDEAAYTLGVMYAIGDFQKDRVVITVTTTGNFMARIAPPTSTQVLGDIIRMTYQQEEYTGHYNVKVCPSLSDNEALSFLGGVMDASGRVFDSGQPVAEVRPDRSRHIKNVFHLCGIYVFDQSMTGWTHKELPVPKRWLKVNKHSRNLARAIIPTSLTIPEAGFISAHGIQLRMEGFGETRKAEVFAVKMGEKQEKYALEGCLMSWAD